MAPPLVDAYFGGMHAAEADGVIANNARAIRLIPKAKFSVVLPAARASDEAEAPRPAREAPDQWVVTATPHRRRSRDTCDSPLPSDAEYRANRAKAERLLG